MNGNKDKTGHPANPGQAAPNTGRSITFWIYGLAALLIFLSTASLTFVAHMAWREADRRALESEQLRFDNTMQTLLREIARNQIALAQWDRTFNALQPPIDKAFIETELVRDLWTDFGLNRTFLVAPDGRLLAQAIEDKARFEPVDLPRTNQIRTLAETTRTAFKQRQDVSSSIFAEWYVPQAALIGLASTTYAVIDGSPALLSAIPVLPNDGHVRFESDYPVVLVSATYLDDRLLGDLHERLAYPDLTFTLGAPARPHPTKHPIHTADGAVFGHFQWDHAKPGREIWIMAMPLILLLASIIAVVAFAAATRISRLSASLEESERKNRHFARHDALTGLPNRHHFSDCLGFAIDGLPERGFAVLACDLDRFKPVNDTYGHEAGDRVICTVADRLEGLVGDAGIVSRIGGDEFIILLSQPHDRLMLADRADGILTEIARPIDIGNGHSVEIGLSIGIASAPECGSSEKDLIRMADMALYRAKENGRNGFEFAGPHSVEAAQARLQQPLTHRPART